MVLWRLNAENQVDRKFIMDRRNKTCIEFENSWKETRQEI
jgi:hypothetical protein